MYGVFVIFEIIFGVKKHDIKHEMGAGFVMQTICVG
jgi:hypothetical protein